MLTNYVVYTLSPVISNIFNCVYYVTYWLRNLYILEWIETLKSQNNQQKTQVVNITLSLYIVDIICSQLLHWRSMYSPIGNIT